jgi:Mrp family chromosome partitioning ATPase
LRAAQESAIPVLGVIENMSGYHCPGCADVQPLFDGSAGQSLADEFAVPLLGRLPFRPHGDGPGREALASTVQAVLGRAS